MLVAITYRTPMLQAWWIWPPGTNLSFPSKGKLTAMSFHVYLNLYYGQGVPTSHAGDQSNYTSIVVHRHIRITERNKS